MRWTRTSVLTPRRAISAAAMTVLPNAVGAHKHASVVGQHRRRRPPAGRAGASPWKVDVERFARQSARRADRRECRGRAAGERGIQAAARQARCDCGIVLGAADDARLVPHRTGASPAPCRTRGSGRRPGGSAGWPAAVAAGLLEVDQVGQRHRQRLRHRAGNRLVRWRRGGSTASLSSSSMKVTSSGCAATGRAQDRRLDVCAAPSARRQARNAHWSG